MDPRRNFVVELNGAGFFEHGSNALRRVGLIITSGIYVSSDTVHCANTVLTSMLQPGIYDVSLSMNGFDFIPAGNMEIIQSLMVLGHPFHCMGARTDILPLPCKSLDCHFR